MKLFTFDSQDLDVDWISFNIQGLTDSKTIIYLSTLPHMFQWMMYLVLGFMV